MAAYSNKHLKNNEYLGNKCSQKSVVQKMIIQFDFQRKSVECGAVGAKCLFLWSGPKEDKKVEKRRVRRWLCGEWIGEWRRVCAKQGYSRPKQLGYQFI